MRLVIIVAALLSASAAQAQAPPRTVRVSEQAGSSLYAKVEAAQTSCDTNNPCVIVFSRQLPKYANESLPSVCNGCTWIDERVSGVWSYSGSSGVDSVFGRTGAVTAQSGDYSWSQIGSKPSTFPPEAHTHSAADIVSGSVPLVSRLIADTAGSTNNTLTNTGMSFSIAANEVYTLDCQILFTVSATSGVGLTLGVNGPGTPTQVSLMRWMNTTATANRIDSSTGASWGAKVGATATTVTSLSRAHFTGLIENGSTAGTLDIQYANIGSTGTTVVKRGSWCKLQKD